ncbi:MAG TPA: lipid A biosynthesis acyltransferase [Burkholderiales bacterium]|nr:lipid A biosynthesis acyltransferase [Burkholderiales bacterium]
MSRVVFGLMWLAHFLPLDLLAALGNALGAVAFWLIPERRHVARVNLARCFPDMVPAARELLVRAHFRAFMRALVEHALWWWAPRERIERLVRLEGMEHLRALRGQPVILLMPHFVGLDAVATRLSFEIDGAGVYAKQKDPLYERLLARGRNRFGRNRLISRQDGVRAAIRAIRDGYPLFYLPDLDFGPRDAIFVPFFGVPAATVTGASRLARITGAKVLPLVARMLPGGGGYVGTIHAPWADFPSEHVAADTRRVSAFIEQRVLEMPEQYLWLHKRFKTRPPGEARFYD